MLTAINSCTKDILTGNTIQFSRDTVYFDTVFTQLGSATRRLKVYNPTEETIYLNKVWLGGGSASVFRMNVDGFSGKSIEEEIEILPKDSIFVFLEVTIDPNGTGAQLIQKDSVLFETDKGIFSVVLVAFGKNAHYYFPTDTFTSGLPYSIICNEIWMPGKPYVIVGYAFIDENCKLTIEAGTDVHFFSNGALVAFTGSQLIVNGELNNPVVFQGTRLGFAYEEIPGQWDRILLMQSSFTHSIKNAVIKNNFIGLQLDNIDTGSTINQGHVVLQNVFIRNCTGIGIFSRAYNIDAYNLMVSNCRQFAIANIGGGNINYYHTTVANYWNVGSRQDPAFFFSNYFQLDANTFLANNLNLLMANSIVYGALDNEIAWDSLPNVAFNYTLKNTLIKIDTEVNITGPQFINVTANLDPNFENVTLNNYTLDEASAAINKGALQTVQTFPFNLTFDIEGQNRIVDGLPDLGAIEAQTQ